LLKSNDVFQEAVLKELNQVNIMISEKKQLKKQKKKDRMTRMLGGSTIV